jgi:type 1 glutamine amidotransferase
MLGYSELLNQAIASIIEVKEQGDIDSLFSPGGTSALTNSIKGLNDFELKTEQYYMHFDPMIEILATTKFNGDHDEWIEGVEMPVVWKKPYGKGRVFYSALGHSADIFEIHEAWTLMTRGIEWAVK